MPRAKKKRNTFLGFTSRVLMLVAAGVLFFSYFSVLVSPVHGWLFSCMGLLFIPLMLLNLLLLVWAVKRRSKAFVIPLVALLPSLLFIGEYFQFGSKDGNPDDVDSVTIVSYNVGRFAEYKHRRMPSMEACMDSVFCYLKAQDADIICLQEFCSDDDANIKALFKKYFPSYHSAYYTYFGKHSRYGNVTLSRLPIVNKDEIRFEKSTNVAIYTDIVIGERTIRVYNCHLQSYNIPLGRVLRSLGRDKELIRSTETKMKQSSEKRPIQVARIMSSIEESNYPTIICGDFNDTPVSNTYYKLRKGHEDSFVDAGRGFGATYSLLWPLLRIDYVLYPKSMKAVSHKTPHKKYSDHYPVIVKLK